ncbi:hypothetical protein AOCH_002104 [Aspergillus ochraceoroseus]|uniref:3-hydroxyanthranilate 3,4-dioxygenase n=1 Tax=Aspergillus ochraceoroseus TaxID=138278 RepID=A0A0F8UXU5_9EURO|nr:hypothetical protein AOCH_002104 [Aspergillus ochraceoroseus]
MLPPALNIPKCRIHRDDRGRPQRKNRLPHQHTPEFFYQYRGSMLLRTVDTSVSPARFQDIPIHEGSMFLLPANTPHCPVRFRDTVGVVMEQPRAAGAVDAMRWYCANCGQIVWEKQFICTDLGTQVKEVVEEFAGDPVKRTCKACGTVAESRYKEGEVVQLLGSRSKEKGNGYYDLDWTGPCMM